MSIMNCTAGCFLFAAVIGSAGAAISQTKPAVLTVSVKEQDSAYRTVQEAVDHTPASGGIIYIKPGIYKEKISVEKPNVWLVGLGASPGDVVITYGDSAKNTGSTFRSGTIIVDADGFEAENLTIANTWWDEHTGPNDGSQAVALQLSSDKAILDRVRLTGVQDTLFAASRTCHRDTEAAPCSASRQYFNDCFVEGSVDYIFGDSKAVFDHCELHSRPHSSVMITAQSRHFPEDDSGYYFLACRITGENNGSRVFFGRPWRDYANVWFYNTDIEQKIAPEGWEEWGGRLKTATYREYKSHGPGANEGHRSVSYPPLFAGQEETFSPHLLLKGDDSWNPVSEVSRLRQLIP